MEKKCYFGLDCVRVMSLCLLLWLHFLLRNGFYSKKMAETGMVAAAAGRILFMSCVPIFLMLTGYLKCPRKLEKGVYKSLFPILTSWVIISVVCLFFDIFVLNQKKTVYMWFVNFFDFKLANYSWYIEMYIGLLLLSPFINTMWEALGTKKNHMLLLGVFFFLTFIPKTVNVLKLDGENDLNLIPNYWVSLWLLTYYLIGCYIRTYRPAIKARFAVPLAVLTAFAFSLINRYTGGGGKFSDGFTISYNHLGTAVISVLLFLSVYQADTSVGALRKTARVLSSVTMEMYLISCVFDQKIYIWDKGAYPAPMIWPRGLAATALVFILSFLSGWLVHQISVLFTGMVRKTLDKRASGTLAEKTDQGG